MAGLVNWLDGGRGLNSILRSFFLWGFVVIALAYYFGLDIAPSRVLFELLIFGVFGFSVLKIKKLDIRYFFCVFIVFLYTIFSYFYSVLLVGDHPLDFLLIFKSFIYLIMAGAFSNAKIIDHHQFSKIFNFLLFLFFTKYFYLVVAQASIRPQLFLENNYELLMLALLAYLKFRVNGLSYFSQFVLISIFLMSASRSGLGVLVFLLVVINYEKLTLSRLLLGSALLLVAGYFVVEVFLERLGGGGIESIDRYVFLMRFLAEIKDWNFFNYLFGVDPITPLSEDTCRRLSYYQSLFSTNGDQCYSVILHSFLLRTIYDHGIVGVLLIIYMINRLLFLWGFRKRDRLVVIGILALNSLSVSGLNSPFAVVGLMFYAFVFRRGVEEKPSSDFLHVSRSPNF